MLTLFSFITKLSKEMSTFASWPFNSLQQASIQLASLSFAENGNAEISK